MPRSPRITTFLGIAFHVETLESAARSALRAAHTQTFRYVVTPNVQHVVAILNRPASIRPLYQSAWRTYCDSRILSRLARLFGHNLPVITGSDLTVKILEMADAGNLTVAIVGPSATDCAKLRVRYPRLRIACHAPPMGFMERKAEVAACVDFIKQVRAPIVFLAVGMPRQEMLASLIASHPNVGGIGLCIGASIDFLTGKQTRAPLWVQNAGLEWLYRLGSDPIRMAPRYLGECPKLCYFLWREMRGLNTIPPR